MVELRNVKKIYSSGVAALKDVSLEINKGEFVFLVGSSGSGKSTLLKLLLKEEEPTSGEVIVNDKLLNNMTSKHIPYLRRSLGIVFQDFRLLPDKTIYENVAFAMQVVDASPREIRRQVPMCLGLVGVSHKAKAFPGELSGGEQQRVALARAIVNQPLVLIADEPTGNLDPETTTEIMKLLCEINNRGTTVIVATHEKSVVDSMKKRVIAIEGGIIVRDEEKGSYKNELQDV